MLKYILNVSWSYFYKEITKQYTENEDITIRHL